MRRFLLWRLLIAVPTMAPSQCLFYHFMLHFFFTWFKVQLGKHLDEQVSFLYNMGTTSYVNPSSLFMPYLHVASDAFCTLVIVLGVHGPERVNEWGNGYHHDRDDHFIAVITSHNCPHAVSIQPPGIWDDQVNYSCWGLWLTTQQNIICFDINQLTQMMNLGLTIYCQAKFHISNWP